VGNILEKVGNNEHKGFILNKWAVIPETTPTNSLCQNNME
jgi:hypothetical protein